MKSPGKRNSLFLVAGVLLLNLLLMACDSETSIATPPSATPVAATSPNPVDLNVWMYRLAPEAGPPPADWIVYKRVREKLGINLKFTMLNAGSEGVDQLVLAVNSSNPPDLFELPGTSIPGKYRITG